MKAVATMLLMLAGCQALANTVVLYEDRAVEVADTLTDPNDLWVKPAELTRVNGFELNQE